MLLVPPFVSRTLLPNKEKVGKFWGWAKIPYNHHCQNIQIEMTKWFILLGWFNHILESSKLGEGIGVMALLRWPKGWWIYGPLAWQGLYIEFDSSPLIILFFRSFNFHSLHPPNPTHVALPFRFISYLFTAIHYV